MTPLLPLLAGLLLLGAAWATLRSFGPRLRVGRLLATTPRVTVGEARRLAEAGVRRYVRVDGRIDSETPFEDDAHRPLVFRRTRLQARAERGGWRTLEDGREAVAFEVHEGLDAIAVDTPSLGEGLVVVPREATGVAADLGERADALAPDTPVRLRVEQVSAVEHASVLGVPVLEDGEPRIGPGLGRPLVLTTLEPPEAMRVLAEGQTAAPRAAAAMLGLGLVLIVIGLGWLLVAAVT